MAVKIRLAVPDDVPGLFNVRTSVKENAMNQEEMQALGITPEAITSMILASDYTWVAVDDERIVGFSMIIPEDNCLFAAFVLPQYEGFGLGKQLVQIAEQALFTHSVTIWLETGKHTRAAGFYRHLGWGNEQDAGDGDIRLEKRRQG